jgi:putative endonuclease
MAVTPAKPWFLYVLECRNGTLYTGVTMNVEARYRLHQAGKGARYTRSFPPTRLLTVVELVDKSAALKAEHAFKQLNRSQKLAFVEQHSFASHLTAP